MLDPQIVKNYGFKPKALQFKEHKGFNPEFKKTDDEKKTDDSDEAMDQKKQDWVKSNCIVIHHDTGTGRSLLCQDKGILAEKIYQFLEQDVRSISKNCEFLARHLRFERTKIQRFLEKAKKAFGTGDKAEAEAPKA